MKNNILNTIIAIVAMIATVIAFGFLRQPKKVQKDKEYEVAPLELDSATMKDLGSKFLQNTDWDSIIKSDLEKQNN
jgi:hypothetical protein